jgi:hypothetical protein
MCSRPAWQAEGTLPTPRVSVSLQQNSFSAKPGEVIIDINVMIPSTSIKSLGFFMVPSFDVSRDEFDLFLCQAARHRRG